MTPSETRRRVRSEREGGGVKKRRKKGEERDEERGLERGL